MALLDQAGREMVDFLASKQCKNIMVICDPVAIPTFDELKNAISDQCKKHGVIKGLAIAGEPVLQIINQCQDGDFTLAAQRAQRCWLPPRCARRAVRPAPAARR